MSEEPRRSGRSTKGQHKNLDMISETPQKKTKAKSQAKEKNQKPSAEPTPAPSEEEEIIRCICGEYEEEEDIERDMICCDQCSAWQHNDCMGLTFAKGEEPDQYFCEQCRPENHKILLEKIARGEKPWEDVAEQRRREAEEKKYARRRKGKKGGRRGRPSEAKVDKKEGSTPTTTPAASATPAAAPSVPAAPATVTPVPEKKSQGPEEQPVGSQKRKFDEHQEVPTPESGPKSKQQKVAAPAKETPAKEISAEETPAKETLAKETPAKETPAKEAPAKETPAKETPAKAAPAKAAPAKAIPAKATPAKAASVKAAPVKAAPVKGASVKATPKAATSQTTKSTEVKDELGAQTSQPQDSREISVADIAVVHGVRAMEDISNAARKSAATALVKFFVDQISDPQSRGSFKLPEGKSGEDIGQQLGLSIESAMYQNLCGGSGEPTQPYKLQLRTILFNVKKNPSLRDRLLVGSLLPDALSKMSSQDMASEELQQKDAEIKREAERQHIIVQDQGPRIRRTHKGEELVEDDQQNAASEPVFSAGPRRNVADTDGSPVAQSPMSPHLPQPETDGAGKPTKSQESRPNERTTHDEHFPPRGHSPGGTSHEQVFPEVATHIREPIPTNKVQADAEIDQLLKDDEPESPPYSPKDFHDEGAIWHGKVVMNPISEFTSSAKHVGGADLSGRIPWSQLVPSTLLIDGRIEVQLASNYLCGLRFSSSTDVSVIAIKSPESPKEKSGFDRLFNYFQERKRYGVIGKHPLPAVKDTYLIPIEAGASKKPEFIELLENNALEDPTPDRTLLVVFAVKTGESNTPSVQPPSHHSSMEPAASASPLTVTSGTPQQPQFLTPGPRQAAQFPSTPTPTFTGAPPTQNSQQPPPPAQFTPYQPPSQDQPSVTGVAAAVQVLGTQANSPAIQQLLQQAPNADVSQLSVIQDILVRRPEAANDYQMLMGELYHATTNGHGPQQNAK